MREPLVVRVVREMQRDLLAHERAQVQAMARRWLAVENHLRQDALALATEVARLREAGEVVTLGRLYRMQRYQILLAQVQGEVAAYTAYAEQTIAAEQAALARLGLEDGFAAVQASMFDAWGTIGLNFNRVNVTAVENIIALARAGQPLDMILQRTYPITAQAISDRLIQAVAEGWGPRKTAASIINDGLAEGLDHILLVARDQEIRAYREATREAYRESGIRRYRRCAAHDARTCPACLALDGTEYDTDELMEIHPQDRCAIIPIVPGADNPTWPSGQEWFDQQPADVQQSILGPGRYDAYQAGAFEFSQLATPTYSPVWGPGVQVTPLRELVA